MLHANGVHRHDLPVDEFETLVGSEEAGLDEAFILGKAKAPTCALNGHGWVLTE